MTPEQSACFLFGYCAAARIRTPKWLRRHLQTAKEVIEGGASNPLSVYAMQSAAVELLNAEKDKRKPVPVNGVCDQ